MEPGEQTIGEVSVAIATLRVELMALREHLSDLSKSRETRCLEKHLADAQHCATLHEAVERRLTELMRWRTAIEVTMEQIKTAQAVGKVQVTLGTKLFFVLLSMGGAFLGGLITHLMQHSGG